MLSRIELSYAEFVEYEFVMLSSDELCLVEYVDMSVSVELNMSWLY